MDLTVRKRTRTLPPAVVERNARLGAALLKAVSTVAARHRGLTPALIEVLATGEWPVSLSTARRRVMETARARNLEISPWNPALFSTCAGSAESAGTAEAARSECGHQGPTMTTDTNLVRLGKAAQVLGIRTTATLRRLAQRDAEFPAIVDLGPHLAMVDLQQVLRYREARTLRAQVITADNQVQA